LGHRGTTSFGFLVRRAAAVWLDVAESELDLGIQPVMDPNRPPSARIFISDTLENGAGYSTDGYTGSTTTMATIFSFKN
jgi:DEAD/DEAH box helicase domain-containing protein